MNDQEAAAYTRGHAVGERELKAAEKRWQVERSMLIAQRDARADEADRALEEIAWLRRRWHRDVWLMWGCCALIMNAVWMIATRMGVV